MKPEYDIIIVGAGPAGSTAARMAALGGASVLLLEKDREIGIPVRCAEGVGQFGLSALIDIKPHWIAKKISGAMLHAPSGAQVPLHTEQIGYVLNRKIFDFELAQMAALAGVDIETRAFVCNLLHDAHGVAGVIVNRMGDKQTIRCKIVIGADGVESRVGRWAGLDTTTPMRDMETCAQVTIGNYNGEANTCHFYFSQRSFPGGYGWVFPKGQGMANIGLGISGKYAHLRAPCELLEDFLRQHYPHAAILTRVAGGVPCALPVSAMVANGLMIVGDAAHQVNPLTGGGIVSSMAAAQMAGRIAAEAIAKRDVSAKALSAYEKEWRRQEGKKMAMYYRLKQFVFDLDDDAFNHIANTVLKLEPKKRTMVNIFKAALLKKPSLMLDVVKLFAQR
ncbi:NAD(P)/FAD-dependent oxidoreductase [candidate division KSB1 bacterium]|nr:NAD(P)/FAD-dependent oxidoreductase [candidate division KSB1 bacterium]